MKKYLLIGVLLIAAFACIVPVPTQIPSTAATTAPPTIAPSATPTSGPQQFFTEQFDNVTSDWSITYLPQTGPTKTPIDKVSVDIADGFLQFNIDAPFVGAFATYEPVVYKDVRLDAQIENQGDNTNDLALMCRYSDKGWYEFNIESSGLYFFNYVDLSNGLHIYQLADGGSKRIKQDVNEYGMSCKGNAFVMYINGTQIKVVNDNNLASGKVAVQGFSLNRINVKLYYDWVKISQP